MLSADNECGRTVGWSEGTTDAKGQCDDDSTREALAASARIRKSGTCFHE